VEGQDVFFPCRVSGVPEPMVTWRKLAGELILIRFLLARHTFLHSKALSIPPRKGIRH